MIQYVIRRSLVGILLLLIMSVGFFFLVSLTPGPPFQSGENPKVHADVVAARIHNLGLDQPIHIRYFTWMGHLLTGNLDQSYQQSRPVTEVIMERLPNTLLLLGVALIVSLIIAVPLGVLAATKQYSLFDGATSLLAYIGVSVPSFVLGLSLLIFFCIILRQWTGFGFPLSGMFDVGYEGDPVNLAFHMVLPVTSLAILQIAGYSRFMRASMLDVLNLDFVRTAKAKGLGARMVLYKHALRNALLPIITIITLTIPTLISGAVITEGIFSWPGMGQLVVQSIAVRDYPVILGVLMITALMVIISNLVADLLYALADPRISYA
ncbi:MAG: ABC transporter permease [Candidatus Dormibacteria bacterium]